MATQQQPAPATGSFPRLGATGVGAVVLTIVLIAALSVLGTRFGTETTPAGADVGAHAAAAERQALLERARTEVDGWALSREQPEPRVVDGWALSREQPEPRVVDGWALSEVGR